MDVEQQDGTVEHSKSKSQVTTELHSSNRTKEIMESEDSESQLSEEELDYSNFSQF